MAGSQKKLDELLRGGGDVQDLDADNISALMVACRIGNMAIIKVLQSTKLHFYGRMCMVVQPYITRRPQVTLMLSGISYAMPAPASTPISSTTRHCTRPAGMVTQQWCTNSITSKPT